MAPDAGLDTYGGVGSQQADASPGSYSCVTGVEACGVIKAETCFSGAADSLTVADRTGD